MSLDAAQEASRAQFDRQSSRYGKSHILADVSDVDALLDLIPGTKTGLAALDIATGGGHTGVRLAEAGYEVICADIAQGMLDGAAKLAAERGVKIQTRMHPAEVLPYPDAHFDLVSCRVAAHHFSSPQNFINETARVLRTGGYFLLIDGSIQDNEPVVEAWLHQVEKWRDPSHGRFLSPGTWQTLCASAGLNVVEIGLTPFKQPDLNWYFETASTSEQNRTLVLKAVEAAPERVKSVLQLREEDGKIVWWWPRLGLLAAKTR